MPSVANGFYGINQSWYHVLSKLANYKWEHWGLLVDFLYEKLLLLANNS